VQSQSLQSQINNETDTKPNIYYLSATAPMDWLLKAEMPVAMKTWKAVNPFMWGIVGLNVLGVLVMLGKQLLIKEEPLESEEAKQGGGNQYAD
jgi:tetrathionate reductase subunit B